MTLKEQYWKDGYVFRFRDGKRRMVCGDKLIDRGGYIHKNAMTEYLAYAHSAVHDRVVAIYKPYPNKGVCCLGDFLKCNELVWQQSEYMMTIDEIKEKLNIPYSKELIIVKD